MPERRAWDRLLGWIDARDHRSQERLWRKTWGDPAVRTATVLRPGDRVLLTISDDLPGRSDTQVQEVLDGLSEYFPGVAFAIATGISGVAVAPPAVGAR